MPDQPEIHVARDDSWAREVADAWRARVRATPGLRMCLPTGSTPAPLYAEMTRRDLTWADARVVLLDEWAGLPPGEPGGCDATLRRQLLDHVDLPATSYRAIDADAADLDTECADVDSWIDEGGLDLAILGVGTNGHLGMNEPGADPRARTHRTPLAQATIDASARYFEGRATPTHGVTVGLADLLAAREVWVLVTGAHKAPILQSCVMGEVRAGVPGSLLRRHPRCRWWVDTSAAARLPGF